MLRAGLARWRRNGILIEFVRESAMKMHSLCTLILAVISVVAFHAERSAAQGQHVEHDMVLRNGRLSIPNRDLMRSGTWGL